MSLSNRSTRRTLRTAPLLVESLEGRRLMTVITVPGTPGNDSFKLDGLKAGDQIVYDGKGGHDTLYASTPGTTESILGNVTVKSTNGGTFELFLYDDGSYVDHALKVGRGKVAGLFPGTVDYSQTTLKSLNLFASSKTTSTAEIYDSAKSSNELVTLSGKWDVKVGNETGTLDAIKGYTAVSVFPNSGSAIKFNDVSDTADRSLKLNGNSVSGLTPGPLSYSNFDTIAFTLGSGKKTIGVTATDAPTQITSFDGNNQITVGSAGSFDFIKQPLRLANIFGTNSVKFDGSAETVGKLFIVEANKVTLPHAAVTLAGNTTVSLLTGKGNDAVDVRNTNANAFTLNTGAGKDSVALIASTGPLTVDTGSDTDTVSTGTYLSSNLGLFAKPIKLANAETLNFSDQGQTAGHAYALSSSGLKRDGVTAFTFTQPKSISLVAGVGNDDLDAYAVGGSTAVSLYGNSGDDKLVGHHGIDLLYGNAGDDTLIAGGGHDSLYGGDDDDLLKVAGNESDTLVDGESGTDTVRYDGAITPKNCEHLVKTVIVTGNVFTDTNGNGKRDGSEKGRAGVQVFVDTNFSGGLDAGDPIFTTDASGNYTMHDVDYGPDIHVFVLPPAGYHQTNNGGQPNFFGATQGSTKTGVNFGVRKNG